ncbi:MAG: type II/IV secretion system ATPase subunit [DPANN group archaeon]|nr:type II/IV secretion system ATPase subunit [DPANN group archaeon]
MIRGWLRKKYFDVKKTFSKDYKVYNFEDEIAKFKIIPEKLGSHMTVFPDSDVSKNIDITYPLIPPFAYANISYDAVLGSLLYSVKEPVLTNRETAIYKVLEKHLETSLDIKFDKESSEKDLVQYLIDSTVKIIHTQSISLRSGEITKIMYYIYRNFLGLNQLEPLLNDINIEDVGCDGYNVPFYIVHKKYGALKTDVIFNDSKKLSNFIVKLAERCNRYVSYAEPLLDGTLPDGSRIQATYTADITTRGPTFSIRKFQSTPFSIIDLIKLGTGSVDLFAYLWYLVEHGKNILIIGTTSAGKTSFLNSLVSFMPPESKIVSIEDTRELNIPHDNWIPSVVRHGFGPSSKKYGTVTMFDLLKESFRQNPDYVIVGEVRGEEANVLFQGMASGHSSFSTFHAGTVDEIIQRLETPPISLQPSLINSLDAVITIQHAKEVKSDARRIKCIDEISDVDPKSGAARTIRSFEWIPSADYYVEKNSLLMEQMGIELGIPIKSIVSEIELRKKLLNWLLENNISSFDDVSSYIARYYNDKENLLSRLGKKVYMTEHGIFTNKAHSIINENNSKQSITNSNYAKWLDSIDNRDELKIKSKIKTKKVVSKNKDSQKISDRVLSFKT